MQIFEQNVHPPRRAPSNRVGEHWVGAGQRPERVEWDNSDIESWSLWFDFTIFLLTLVVVPAVERSSGTPGADRCAFLRGCVREWSRPGMWQNLDGK
jgi:hypothetical protein